MFGLSRTSSIAASCWATGRGLLASYVIHSRRWTHLLTISNTRGNTYWGPRGFFGADRTCPRSISPNVYRCSFQKTATITNRLGTAKRRRLSAANPPWLLMSHSQVIVPESVCEDRLLIPSVPSCLHVIVDVDQRTTRWRWSRGPHQITEQSTAAQLQQSSQK